MLLLLRLVTPRVVALLKVGVVSLLGLLKCRRDVNRLAMLGVGVVAPLGQLRCWQGVSRLAMLGRDGRVCKGRALGQGVVVVNLHRSAVVLRSGLGLLLDVGGAEVERRQFSDCVEGLQFVDACEQMQ